MNLKKPFSSTSSTPMIKSFPPISQSRLTSMFNKRDKPEESQVWVKDPIEEVLRQIEENYWSFKKVIDNLHRKAELDEELSNDMLKCLLDYYKFDQ
jgi:hypothetical protein